MILRRDVKGNLVTAYYNSSNILSSIYDTNNKTLEVVFKRGARYLYENVDNVDYMRFELADSQGQVLNSHIKKYTFSKLDTIESKKLEEDVDKFKELEIQNVVTGVIDRLLNIISSSDEHSPDTLNRIIKECEKGLEITKKYV
jgi:hypothetical protein